MLPNFQQEYDTRVVHDIVQITDQAEHLRGLDLARLIDEPADARRQRRGPMALALGRRRLQQTPHGEILRSPESTELPEVRRVTRALLADRVTLLQRRGPEHRAFDARQDVELHAGIDVVRLAAP